ncbi:MAG: DUF4062 domain-containing protein [Chitinophagaceae bacterium]
MQSKWKVYLSSTFIDLKDKRQEIINYFHKQLRDSFELTTIMERMYDDGSHTAFELDCKSAVSACDIYILIQGNKVGSYPPNSNTTYTEQELDTAINEKKSIFILQLCEFDDDEIGAENLEKHREILSKFKGKPVHLFSDVTSIKNSFLEFLTPYINTSPVNKQNPYKGLSSFNVSDNAYFFGRAKEKDDFLSRIIPRTKANRFISVIGNSGVGKTSFVQAGILSELKTDLRYNFNQYKQVIVTPGSTPFTNLKFQININGVEGIFTDNEIRIHEDEKVIIFFNQFEEIITQCHTDAAKEECKTLFSFLKDITDQEQASLNILIITTFRSDYFSALSNFDFIKHHQIYFPMVSLDYSINEANWRESIVEIITRPALKNGVTVEKELVNKLCTELQEIDGSLPILQFTLHKLWTNENIADRIITSTEYEILSGGKGMAGVIEAHAENVFKLITNNSKEKENVIRTICLNLVEVTENKLDVRKTMLKKDLFQKLSTYNNAIVQEVFEALVNEKSRIISISETKDQNYAVDIVHEVLIRKWERLKQWVNDRRSSLEKEKEFEQWVKKSEKIEGKTSVLNNTQIAEIRNFKSENKDILLNESVERLFLKSKKERKKRIYLIISLSFIFFTSILLGIRPYQKYKFEQDVKGLKSIRDQIDSSGGSLKNVTEIRLEHDNCEKVLAGLHNFYNLKRLNITTDMKDLSAISNSSSVSTLVINITNNLKRLKGIERFKNLRCLEIRDIPNDFRIDLSLLNNMPSLDTLVLWNRGYVVYDTTKNLLEQSLSGIQTNRFIKHISINNEMLPAIMKVGNLPAFKSLYIYGSFYLAGLEDLKIKDQITALEIDDNSYLESYSGIGSISNLKVFKNLHILKLTNSIELSSLYGIENLSLDELHLHPAYMIRWYSIELMEVKTIKKLYLYSGKNDVDPLKVNDIDPKKWKFETIIVKE